MLEGISMLCEVLYIYQESVKKEKNSLARASDPNHNVQTSFRQSTQKASGRMNMHVSQEANVTAKVTSQKV